ncbi:MAG: hypothetical protein HGA53_06560 [Anaerolineaceae bacterium]|nr:hypothetical protein [Anaerolineaceae bacterium]
MYLHGIIILFYNLFMANNDLTFWRLEKFLEEKLLSIGYQLMNERFDPEHFGSRSVDFQNENRVFHLVLDGRDGCIEINYCDDVTKSPFESWKIIATQLNDPDCQD